MALQRPGIYCEAEMGIGRLVVPDEAGDMTAMRKLLGVGEELQSGSLIT